VTGGLEYQAVPYSPWGFTFISIVRWLRVAGKLSRDRRNFHLRMPAPFEGCVDNAP